MAELSVKEKKILWYVYGMGQVSRKTLLELSHFKAPTLYRVIENLVQEGWMMICGSEEDGGKGRPTDILSVNRKKAAICSIHISRSKYQCAIVNFGHEILTMKTHDIEQNLTPQAMTEQLFADFIMMCRECGWNRNDVWGVGLSAVGPLDYQRGIMIHPLHFHADSWENVPIVEIICSRFGQDVFLDCNASSALMGHYMSGCMPEYQNAVYISVGTGIGSGLIVNRKLITKRNVILDGFAHMIVDMDGRKCTCGEYGCVEAYASTSAILEQCSKEMKGGAQSCMRGHMEHLKLEDLQEAVLQKDGLALEQTQKAAGIFAKCIVNYLRLVNLDLVILGGSLIETVPFFYQQIESLVKQKDLNVSLLMGRDEDRHIIKGISSEVVRHVILGE